MHIVESHVHIWGADTPSRPWPPGRAQDVFTEHLPWLKGEDLSG